MVAAEFVNRLRFNMPLQTDPTVIYGLADKFDGNLRKKDLLTDHEYNTYTRRGLPPTPLRLPGLPSIQAVLNPRENQCALFCREREWGISFLPPISSDHNRAVLEIPKNAKVGKMNPSYPLRDTLSPLNPARLKRKE